jgi:hypothetical protein
MSTPSLALLKNNTLNVVYPPQPLPVLPDKDARDYALERLREYFCSLIFRRTNAPGLEAIPFCLPFESVLIQQPDDLKDAPLPGIAIIPGRGVHDTYGLGPPTVLEDTVGVAGPGTALLRAGDYIEPFIVEVWGSKKAERRALVAGLKAAFRANDGSSAIFLSLPAYYNETAAFELIESQYIDGDEVSRNRRRAHLMVTMRVCEVTLVNVRQMNADVATTVLDGNVFLTLDC